MGQCMDVNVNVNVHRLSQVLLRRTQSRALDSRQPGKLQCGRATRALLVLETLSTHAAGWPRVSGVRAGEARACVVLAWWARGGGSDVGASGGGGEV
jgi:hypothetical protein